VLSISWGMGHAGQQSHHKINHLQEAFKLFRFVTKVGKQCKLSLLIKYHIIVDVTIHVVKRSTFHVFIYVQQHLLTLEVGSVYLQDAVVSVAVAVPLVSWGTTAATRVPRLRIGERPREWTRG